MQKFAIALTLVLQESIDSKTAEDISSLVYETLYLQKEVKQVIIEICAKAQGPIWNEGR